MCAASKCAVCIDREKEKRLTLQCIYVCVLLECFVMMYGKSFYPCVFSTAKLCWIGTVHS